MRRTFLWSHRWLGLIASVVLFIVALSGSALVFEGAIDRALHPELWKVEPATATLPLDTLAAHAVAATPGAKVGGISLSAVPGRAWVVNTNTGAVFVDPYRGTVLGRRTFEDEDKTLSRRLHVLHVTLFAPRAVGSGIVAACTVVALILVLSGLALWWRDKIWNLKAGGSWKRINFDLHHALGLFAALVLIVITASGLVIHYGPISKVILSLNSAPPAPVPMQPAGPPRATPLSYDSIAHTAREVLPGAEVMFVSVGGSADFPIVVAMRFPEDHTPAGRSRVFVDRNTGTVLGAASTRSAGLGTRLDNLKRSLHTGDVLGKTTEAIWLIASLVMVEQIVSGVLMWWNGRPARKAAAAREARD